MVIKASGMAIICQWCEICYTGNKEYRGKSSDILLNSDVVVVKDGHCKLCRKENFPVERKIKYGQK